MSTELRVEALIFDLDGTLADTLADIAGALNRVLAARGLPVHGRAEYRRMIGGGALQLVQSALPASARDSAPAVLDEYRRDYHANLLVESAPFPGVTELLDELAARAVPMSVLSNKPHEPTRRVVAGLFPNVPFVDVVGERPDRPRKPDPGVALELAARMQVPPARCGFVGDTGIDVRTARAAGMRAFAVTWGFRDRDELAAAGAEVIVGAPRELLAYVPAVTGR